MKDINLIAYSISVLIAIITFANTILSIIKEDSTKIKLINSLGILFKALGIAFIYNIIYLSGLFALSVIISNVSNIKMGAISSTIAIVTFVIGMVFLVIKTILENKYLLTILENIKHIEKLNEYKTSKMKLLLRSIDQDKLMGKKPDIEYRIEQVKTLFKDINEDCKLNKWYGRTQTWSWLIYPSGNLLTIGFTLKFMNSTSDIPFIILTFILMISFNILMLYRDLSINNGNAKINIDIIESHIFRYEKEIEKNKDNKEHSSNTTTEKL
ncbi:hypothetical protein KJJ36_13830 [Staphylococcus pseudoxylosus]|uniref:hypothetical protein n=1 Tax=Staphylococcus pseudoxylosus TaxID=2282419 RepID=UPI001F2E3649|nr:hypothetical protein [Staphylococcus pseudoxylosus]MCE5003446.1 hypothetical protein [Staphylococcus pseudoxylosus]